VAYNSFQELSENIGGRNQRHGPQQLTPRTSNMVVTVSRRNRSSCGTSRKSKDENLHWWHEIGEGDKTSLKFTWGYTVCCVFRAQRCYIRFEEFC